MENKNYEDSFGLSEPKHRRKGMWILRHRKQSIMMDRRKDDKILGEILMGRENKSSWQGDGIRKQVK